MNSTGGKEMLTWISENIATIIICMVLIAVVTAVIASMVRSKKKENYVEI